MKSFRSFCWLLALAAGVALPAAAQKTELLVYTALETDQIKAYEDGFKKAYPNIDIKWVRDSTGIITAKILAEKANPQADVVMGLAASSLVLFDVDGMLLPYAPKNLAAIAPQYRDAKNPPAWFGMDVWGATVCFNTVEAAKQGLPKPEIVEGSHQAGLQGQDRDAESGVVGHRLLRRDRVAAAVGRDRRLEIHGRAAREHRAVHAFGQQALRPGRQRRVPDRHLVRIPRQHHQGEGRPDRPHLPEGRPGLGSRGGRDHEEHQEARCGEAVRRLDRRRRKRTSSIAANFAIVAIPGIAKPLPNIPADYEKRLVKNDFAWAAKNREKILAEWTKRYDSKSEPKK